MARDTKTLTVSLEKPTSKKKPVKRRAIPKKRRLQRDYKTAALTSDAEINAIVAEGWWVHTAVPRPRFNEESPPVWDILFERSSLSKS